MQNKKHKWVLPLLLISFILYNIGIPLFVHFCASKNTAATSIFYHKDHCKREQKNNLHKKSCCDKKPSKTEKTHISKTENNNCYGEYFAPSDCCKLTYQIKQNHQKYLAETSKNVKKVTPCTLNTFHRYIAGIPAPNLCKYKNNTFSKSPSLEVPLIEYFPLRL